MSVVLLALPIWTRIVLILCFDRILRSKIFKFLVGPNEKEFIVHEAVLHELSEPLRVLLGGPFKEARESTVAWPDVDENTFVRFVEWAYTGSYHVARPQIVSNPNGNAECTSTIPVSEQALYSLNSLRHSNHSPSQHSIEACCRNSRCGSYCNSDQYSYAQMVTCDRCRKSYASQLCGNCASAYYHCPRASCTHNRRYAPGTCCSSECSLYGKSGHIRQSKIATVTCYMCKTDFSTRRCRKCSSVLSECPKCPFDNVIDSCKRETLISKFMSEAGTIYSPLVSPYVPRANKAASEDYTEVFLCHAKLYILGDLYDIPALRQLSFHRLYATLKEFKLFPSRMDDIATLAKYLFENTRSEDRIREMIYLYYACIIEDAAKHDGVQSLINDIPDFAHGLIVKMCERLS